MNNLQYHYFAEDGNYGDATNLVTLETTDFTNDDWELMGIAPESDRLALAYAIKSKYDQTVLNGLPQDTLDEIAQVLIDYEVQ